jgi:eukaryotic-like serine/threonine-protein kinase
VSDHRSNHGPDKRSRARLTVARRNLLDRLMDVLMDVEGSIREQELERIRRRTPRIHRWLIELIRASEDAEGPIDELFQRAGRAARQAGAASELVLAPGARLGAWRVIDAVGSGGMGSVYRAERADGAFEMTVAIKLIRIRQGQPGRATQE